MVLERRTTFASFVSQLTPRNFISWNISKEPRIIKSSLYFCSGFGTWASNYGFLQNTLKTLFRLSRARVFTKLWNYNRLWELLDIFSTASFVSQLTPRNFISWNISKEPRIIKSSLYFCSGFGTWASNYGFLQNTLKTLFRLSRARVFTKLWNYNRLWELLDIFSTTPGEFFKAQINDFNSNWPKTAISWQHSPINLIGSVSERNGCAWVLCSMAKK